MAIDSNDGVSKKDIELLKQFMKLFKQAKEDEVALTANSAQRQNAIRKKFNLDATEAAYKQAEELYKRQIELAEKSKEEQIKKETEKLDTLKARFEKLEKSVRDNANLTDEERASKLERLGALQASLTAEQLKAIERTKQEESKKIADIQAKRDAAQAIQDKEIAALTKKAIALEQQIEEIKAINRKKNMSFYQREQAYLEDAEDARKEANVSANKLMMLSSARADAESELVRLQNELNAANKTGTEEERKALVLRMEAHKASLKSLQDQEEAEASKLEKLNAQKVAYENMAEIARKQNIDAMKNATPDKTNHFDATTRLKGAQRGLEVTREKLSEARDAQTDMMSIGEQIKQLTEAKNKTTNQKEQESYNKEITALEERLGDLIEKFGSIEDLGKAITELTEAEVTAQYDVESAAADVKEGEIASRDAQKEAAQLTQDKKNANASKRKDLEAQKELKKSDEYKEAQKEERRLKDQEINSQFGEELKKGITDSLGNSFAAIGKFLTDLTKTIDDNIDSFYEYQATVEARLQSSGESYGAIMKKMSENIGISPIIQQKAMVENIRKLVDTGVAYNVDLRAFLATVSDKIATTFDAMDKSLLRIVRIQQADTTAARLGMEASLTKLFNEYFKDTSYLTDAFDSVTGAILDASSQLSFDASTEFEYIVQKWLGSLYSLGVSDSAVTKIAEGLNYLGTGDVEKLNSDESLQTLLAMSAGDKYADILVNGLDAKTTNDLMRNMVKYLQGIAKNTETNQVTKSAYSKLFGVSMSDMSSLQNLEQTDIDAIYSQQLSYTQALAETTNQMNQIQGRTHQSQWIDNIVANVAASASTGIGNSPALYGTWQVLNIIEGLTGGIPIPKVSVMGNYVDLNQTITGIAKTGIAGFSLMRSLLSGLFGGNGAGGWKNIDNWGFEQQTKRGTNRKGINTGLSTGVSESTDLSTMTGSSSADDVKNSSLSSATEGADEDSKVTNKSVEGKAEAIEEIKGALQDDKSTVLEEIRKLNEENPLLEIVTQIYGNTQEIATGVTPLSASTTEIKTITQSIKDKIDRLNPTVSVTTRLDLTMNGASMSSSSSANAEATSSLLPDKVDNIASELSRLSTFSEALTSLLALDRVFVVGGFELPTTVPYDEILTGINESILSINNLISSGGIAVTNASDETKIRLLEEIKSLMGLGTSIGDSVSNSQALIETLNTDIRTSVSDMGNSITSQLNTDNTVVVSPPAVNVEAPTVNVSPPSIDVPPPNVTVTPPDVSTPDVTVNVQQPTITPPDVIVDVDTPPIGVPDVDVSITSPDVIVPPIDVPEVPPIDVPQTTVVVDAPVVDIPQTNVTVESPNVELPMQELQMSPELVAIYSIVSDIKGLLGVDRIFKSNIAVDGMTSSINSVESSINNTTSALGTVANTSLVDLYEATSSVMENTNASIDSLTTNMTSDVVSAIKQQGEQKQPITLSDDSILNGDRGQLDTSLNEQLQLYTSISTLVGVATDIRELMVVDMASKVGAIEMRDNIMASVISQMSSSSSSYENTIGAISNTVTGFMQSNSESISQSVSDVISTNNATTDSISSLITSIETSNKLDTSSSTIESNMNTPVDESTSIVEKISELNALSNVYASQLAGEAKTNNTTSVEKDSNTTNTSTVTSTKVSTTEGSTSKEDLSQEQMVELLVAKLISKLMDDNPTFNVAIRQNSPSEPMYIREAFY